MDQEKFIRLESLKLAQSVTRQSVTPEELFEVAERFADHIRFGKLPAVEPLNPLGDGFPEFPIDIAFLLKHEDMMRIADWARQVRIFFEQRTHLNL